MGNFYKKKGGKPVAERPVNEVMAMIRSYGAVEGIQYINKIINDNFVRLEAEYGRELTDREKILTIAAVMDTVLDEITGEIVKNQQLIDWLGDSDFNGQTIKFVQKEGATDGSDAVGHSKIHRETDRLQ